MRMLSIPDFARCGGVACEPAMAAGMEGESSQGGKRIPHKLPYDQSVLFIGDSFTEGFGVSDGP
jgi:hypothetical protein